MPRKSKADMQRIANLQQLHERAVKGGNKAPSTTAKTAVSASTTSSASTGAAAETHFAYEPTPARTLTNGEDIAELIGAAVLSLEDHFFVAGEGRLGAGQSVVLRLKPLAESDHKGADNSVSSKRTTNEITSKKAPARKKHKTDAAAASPSRSARAGKQQAVDKDEEGSLVTVTLPVPLCKLADWPASGPTYAAEMMKLKEVEGHPPFQPTIQALLNAAEPSPFGRGGETVMDESVRKALQIPASRVADFSFDPVQLGIVEKIHRALVPDAAGLTATLHKINIYGKGGFFASHRDTPLDETQVGTLVVCLPVAFRGGVFNITHNGNRVNMKWDNALAEGSRGEYNIRNYSGDDKAMLVNEPAAILPWVAFFGHAEHDITPVDAGLRVTATYILRRQDSDVESEAVIAEQLLLDRLIGQFDTLPGQQQQQQQHAKKKQTKVSLSAASSAAASAPASASAASEPPPLFHATELAGHTVPQLKALCKERKFKVGGSKSELIERLTAKRFMEPRRAMSGGVALMRLLADAQLNENFLSEGGVVAVPCMHMYESAINLPADTNTVQQTSTTHLKGADSIVFVAAARLGLSPEVVRCLYSEVDEAWNVLDDPKYAQMTLAEVAKSVTCIERVEDSFDARAIDTEDWSDRVSFPTKGSQKVYWAIDIPNSAKDVADGRSPVGLGPLLDETWSSGTGYFGNEASCGTLYANAIMLLRFDAFSSASRKRFAQMFTELSQEALVDALQAFKEVNAGESAAAEYKIAEAQSKKILKVKPRSGSRGGGGGFGGTSSDRLSAMMMFALMQGGFGGYGGYGGYSDSDGDSDSDSDSDSDDCW